MFGNLYLKKIYSDFTDCTSVLIDTWKLKCKFSNDGEKACVDIREEMTSKISTPTCIHFHLELTLDIICLAGVNTWKWNF